MRVSDSIHRHALDSTGSFASTFHGFELPPLPAATAQLLDELRHPEPDVQRIIKVISSSPEITAKVLRMVNSSLFALRNPVTSVQQAVTLLGIRHIRSIALSYTVKAALPSPANGVFKQTAYWTDSLLRALLARSFTRRRSSKEVEEAFTAMLLADVALPVLLNCWGDYYSPVVKEWARSSEHLSSLERKAFGWDHAQAGAWILQFWRFPEEMICFIGAHNLTLTEIIALGLEDTIAVSMAVASLAPSVLKPDQARAALLVGMARDIFLITETGFTELLDQVQAEIAEASRLFEIDDHYGLRGIEGIRTALHSLAGSST